MLYYTFSYKRMHVVLYFKQMKTTRISKLINPTSLSFHNNSYPKEYTGIQMELHTPFSRTEVHPVTEWESHNSRYINMSSNKTRQQKLSVEKPMVQSIYRHSITSLHTVNLEGVKEDGEEYEPVLGVIQAHLFFDWDPWGGDSNTPSEATLLGFETERFLVHPKLVDRVSLPVEARLRNESVDASDEHEALRDKLLYSNCSCRRRTLAECDCGEVRTVDTSWDFFSLASLCNFSAFLSGFEAGFRELHDPALFPPGPNTGLAASESPTFTDLNLGPDIHTIFFFNSPLTPSDDSLSSNYQLVEA